MSKHFTKEDVILHKKQAIKKVNKLLEMYINSSDDIYIKKANLLSYWLEDFSKYIEKEAEFNPKRLISYKRGDVIKLNFGFNVGSEQGGLHYAIVLDNNNLHSSSVITVIPLCSGTASSTYSRDVFLGQELYIKLNAKNKALLENVRKSCAESSSLVNDLENTYDMLHIADIPPDQLNAIHKIIRYAKKQIDSSTEELRQLKKYEKEISRMKQGSIAMMEQITTVSKMRIYIPKNTSDTLYGISFSADAMEKINSQLKNLFLNNS